MSPRLELLVALLELAAFFLVTPEIIGRGRLEVAYQWMGRLNHWLRTVWYSPDFGPVPPTSFLVLLILTAFAVCAVLGFDFEGSKALVPGIVAPFIVVPALFVLFYLLLEALHRRAALGRVLAVIGACLFVAGRLIVIASAYGRTPP